MLQSFKIHGLFGTTEVDIPFTENVKILIGENGLGKTTVLSILYYSLTRRYRRLSEYEFASIDLTFASGDVATINRNDLFALSDETRPPVPPSLKRFVLQNLTESEISEIPDIIHSGEVDRLNFYKHPMFNKLMSGRYPTHYLWRAICSLATSPSVPNPLIEYRTTVNNNLKGINILYFPTYRRIEEDLKNLNIEIDEDSMKDSSEKLIQFGMDDVKNKFQALQAEIQRLSSLGLSKISGEILSQLVKGAPEITDFQLDSMSPETIQIILARVGDLLSNDDKARILEIIRNKKLKEEDKFLVYFIQKLIDIYEQQRFLDDKIKFFLTICNQYLSFSHKTFVYNESEVEFYVDSKFFKRKRLIDFLAKLSSGEKQIISLFSKIYLSADDAQFIVLFDEPELSLSVYWQELLLPDVMKSGKIIDLIAATHSPFIYDNNLSGCARGLSEYVKIATEQ